MDADWTFSFRSRSPSAGGLPPSDDVEDFLLGRLRDPHVNRQQIMLELIRLYRSMARVGDALAVATDYLERCADPESKAEVYFHLGQAMEHVRDWESAIRWYTCAKELEPRNRFYWYFIHNNIGFCLNRQGRYSEAESILRTAIGIDPTRANALKNLGLSLEQQGRLAEAVQSYVGAIRADASDPRALRHLVQLAERHLKIAEDVPDIGLPITKCREAVEYAARFRWDKP